MKTKVKSFFKNLAHKVTNFFVKNGERQEDKTLIFLIIEIAISFLIYLLYSIEVYVPKTYNKGVLNLISYTFINFPAILLMAGMYFINNFSMKQGKNYYMKNHTFIGVVLIMFSVALIILNFLKYQKSGRILDSYLLVGTISTFLSILIVGLIFVFKTKYLGIRQLAFLYFSIYVFIAIYLIVMAIIFLFVTMIVISLVFSSSSSSSSSSSQTYRVNRYNDQPERGELYDDAGIPVYENGRKVVVENIDVEKGTAEIDGEKVKIKKE